ncbi:putative LRR receptor-like serine/threonine-protein kinase [Platanthera guangdongensis]|uniref:LRR receptor-like serine/threonine-protein kinase n=1 Tax=Platanthera guangdongensis TaxID=2320717 RepID=A0ABR2MJD4_9ASPA
MLWCRTRFFLDRPSSVKKQSLGHGSGSSGEKVGPKLVMFNNKITYAETAEATKNFDEENTAFCEEAEFLGQVKHRNLTVLRGYYPGPPPEMKLLVYDYLPNSSLATLLQEASRQSDHVLNWPMRHLIALGMARGLAHLHASGIVHGDVKPQNILFDAEFEPHVSDFGLERFESRASTSEVTVGYVAPEAVATGIGTWEGDVYSFGIVVLELLTGKGTVMFAGEEEGEDIVKSVKRNLQAGAVVDMFEPGMLEMGQESSEWEEFLIGVKVGLLCTTPGAADRPAMDDVVLMLEGCRVGPNITTSTRPTAPPISPSHT